MIFIDCEIFWSGKTHLSYPTKKSSDLKCCQYHYKLIIVISTNHQHTKANILFFCSGLLRSMVFYSRLHENHRWRLSTRLLLRISHCITSNSTSSRRNSFFGNNCHFILFHFSQERLGYDFTCLRYFPLFILKKNSQLRPYGPPLLVPAPRGNTP